MTDAQSANSYDEVPYPSYPYFRTHPKHLATIATLLGVAPVVAPYRVLELGCAAGGNLIPMAASLPDCQFVGIDYSERQVAEGQKTIASLGLDNLQLLPLSILDFDESFGQFDYILCHGVYSWVSAEIQTRILQICRQHLSRNGVAYISYNTHPGWRQCGAVRDMMQYHVGRQSGSTPTEQIGQARGLLDFLVSATSNTNHSYAQMLREQQEILAKHSDSYIYHEHLEQHNEPLWFLDFCHRLDQHGLRYVGEADFSSMVASMSLAPELQQQLDQLAPNLTEKEQYIDFVRNRSFRQTLVCHARQRPDYNVRGERLRELFAATSGSIRKDNHEDGGDEDNTEWRLEVDGGLSLSTPLRTTQLAFELLSQAWPERVAVASLVEQVAEQLDDPALDRTELQTTLEVALLTTFSSSSGQLIELSVSPLADATEGSGERPFPMVSRLVQLQAREGLPVVNRRHDLFPMMPLDRRILPLLDGSRGVDQLLCELLAQHQSRDLKILDEHDVAILDPVIINKILTELIPQRLEFYRRGSLLVRQVHCQPIVGPAGTSPDGGPNADAV